MTEILLNGVYMPCALEGRAEGKITVMYSLCNGSDQTPLYITPEVNYFDWNERANILGTSGNWLRENHGNTTITLNYRNKPRVPLPDYLTKRRLKKRALGPAEINAFNCGLNPRKVDQPQLEVRIL